MRQAAPALLCAAALLLLPPCASGERYRIAEVTYDISGMTRQHALELAVPVSTTRVFGSVDEFDDYLADLKQRLQNERVFETVTVTAEKTETEDDVTLVRLNIQTTDSKHFIAVPYPKYDSNTGTTLKLKLKDANFLGTMEPLSFDLSYQHERKEDGSYDEVPGLEFSYRYPFRLWKLDAAWNNALAIRLGKTPEFDATTGITLTLPLDSCQLVLDLMQRAARETDYETYNDELFFTEYARLSLPVTAAEITRWSALTWTPFAAYEYSWDNDGIDKRNKYLRGPRLTFGHSISGGRTDWLGNFRDGFSLEFGQSVTYNYCTQRYSPLVWTEWNCYKAGAHAGFCARLYGFATRNGDTDIGSRLRGIIDKQYYRDGYTDEYGERALSVEVPVAIVCNLDVPIRVLATDWNGWTATLFGEDAPLTRKLNWLGTFDFELQIAPFIDVALTKNMATERLLSPKDGFYCCGLEVLVYPARWRSLEVRASIGVDAGRAIIQKVAPDVIDGSWRDDVSVREVYVGIGLHY